ncbi:MAG: hypothetical protein OEY41_02880 [Acidimicrobiia bacterium]|nr:hypothetical protein [Acidimicrobiia bacterium]MDH4365510.1 hypothetical protein [Acidimicrobiia bacterium]MDH5288923.1 hypothetical protein [Acidimicrobiia bacterium]
MPTIHDPVLSVIPVPGSPGLRLLRVEFVVACAPFDPAIGQRVAGRIVVRAVDEHDADVSPRTDPVVEMEDSFVMAEGRHHRRAERAVHRTDLDVAQDWWDTDQGGSTVPIAEWVDHIAAEVRLTYAGHVVAEGTSPVVTGSWGALGRD